jgi:hypothetical protein
MGHRVLVELSKDNSVLAEIVKPLVDVLGRNEPGVTTATAARALSEFDRVTGRV